VTVIVLAAATATVTVTVTSCRLRCGPESSATCSFGLYPPILAQRLHIFKQTLSCGDTFGSYIWGVSVVVCFLDLGAAGAVSRGIGGALGYIGHMLVVLVF